MIRRRPCMALLLSAPLGISTSAAGAPLTLLVPWPAGGAVDAAARSLQPELAREAGTSVVVDNMPGAGGLIAVERYARHAPAERGLLMGSASDLITGLLTNSTRFRPEDFRLVGIVAAGGYVLVTREKFPVRDFDELVAYARARPPETLKFAHVGKGSGVHLAWEELAGRAGITALQVPYRGAPDMLRDVANGQLDVVFLPLNTAAVSFPGVRALGITQRGRHPLFPQIPTLAESQAAPGFQYEGWIALTVMRDTPAAELGKLERWARNAVQAPAFVEGGRQAGGLPPPLLTRTELDRFYEAEIVRHRAQLQRLGLMPAQ